MKDDVVLLAHGSGGSLMHKLVEEKIAPSLNSSYLKNLDDSAEINLDGEGRVAFTTDSYVVKPIFFPGGNIGSLAVSGTINDLSMKGAKPIVLSLALIIEEGLLFSELNQILESIAKTVRIAGVEIATGDTKVVERNSADKIFINTSGMGIIPADRNISGRNAKPGNTVIITGSIGDHGLAVMSEREDLGLSIPVKSDAKPLNGLVDKLFSDIPAESIKVLRDPTRGGLATTLNEIAQQSKVNIRVEEEKIPVRDEVKGACEILGYDPLYVANEGKILIIVDNKYAKEAVESIRNHPDGKDAEIIGTVEKAKGTKPAVFLKTKLGSSRILTMLSGEQLPRIC